MSKRSGFYPCPAVDGAGTQVVSKAGAVLLTQTVILFQDTSLVYVISATDFLGAAAKVANRDYRLVEMYSFVAVVYFIISFGLSSLVKQLQNRIAIIR